MHPVQIVATLTAALCFQASFAADSKVDQAAKKVAARVTKNLNTMLDDKVICTHASSSGPRTLICMTEGIYFGRPERAGAFSSTLTATAGEALFAHPGANLADVSVMDKSLGEQRKYWSIPAAEALKLQRALITEKINIDQFQTAVKATGRIIDLPAKK